MTLPIKMLIKILLHTTFISLKFNVIVFVVPPEPKCISFLAYIFFGNFTFSQIDWTIIITIKFMIYLESFTCDSTRKGISFCDISANFISEFFMLP